MKNIERASAPITGIDLFGLFAKDVPGEIAFYREVLGMQPTALDAEGRGAEFALADGSTFGLWNPGADGTLPQQGNVTFFSVDDAAAAAASIRERGCAVSEVLETPVCFMAWSADPDGNGFALHQRKERDDTPVPAEPKPTTITGIDIAGVLVTDVERAIAFYRDALGIVPTELDQQGRGAEFTLDDGLTFGVWNPGSEDRSPANAGLLAVADAHATVAQIRARGAAVSDPFETPVCFMAFGRDPEGNGYAIHQRKRRD